MGLRACHAGKILVWHLNDPENDSLAKEGKNI